MVTSVRTDKEDISKQDKEAKKVEEKCRDKDEDTDEDTRVQKGVKKGQLPRQNSQGNIPLKTAHSVTLASPRQLPTDASKSPHKDQKDDKKGQHSQQQNSKDAGVSNFPGMSTDDGQYLKHALGDALTNSLSEVNEARPPDPISYLACCLYTYRYHNKDNSKDDSNKNKNGSKVSSSGSERSVDSSIALQTAVDSTGGAGYTPTPQTRDKNGQSVLHFAASKPHGRSAFYRLVADCGCSIADRDDQYRTPRDVAQALNLNENVKAIDKWVINLAAQGKLEELKKLMLDGYDHLLDVEDEQGNSILEVAEEHGQRATVQFLRSCNNFEEKKDWLHKAIRIGSEPHVEHIADSLEVARAKDERGRTSLHIATLCEEKAIMEILATRYPELLSIGDNLERTPLHYAMAVEGVDEVAKVLVQAGAKRSIKDLRGRTPSANFIHPEAVRALQAEEHALTDTNLQPLPHHEG
nr:serine/threonine-protein phosphatase 6 regulatory ankyrin repeat subunit B-like [Procambarus clarkii]